MSNVVAIHGNTIKGEVNHDIVEELEQLLEEAKAGNLEALAFCTVHNNVKGTGWVGGSGTRDALGVSIMMLNQRYASARLESEV